MKKLIKKIKLHQLKNLAYKFYEVNNSKQLKKNSKVAAKLDLRYRKNWQLLVDNSNKYTDNVISLASHIARKDNAATALDTGLQSLGEDLSAFEQKIESDFADKRNNSKKYRESLTYL